MASKRECFEIPGIVHHGGMFPGAIPFGVRIGDMLFSSATYGQDPATSEYGEGLRAQAELAFQNTEALITKARCSLSDIGHVTVWLRELGDGEGADEFWNAAFPLPSNRPARSDYATDSMPSRIMIQTSIIAVVGAAREVLIVDDVPGYDLAPVGVRMADVVFPPSSRVPVQPRARWQMGGNGKRRRCFATLSGSSRPLAARRTTLLGSPCGCAMPSIGAPWTRLGRGCSLTRRTGQLVSIE